MCVLCEQRKRPQQWRWWWWNGIKWLGPGSSPIWRIRALYSRMHAPEQQHTIFLFLRPAVWLHFILHIRLNIPFGRDGVAYGKPRRSATSLLFSVMLAFRSFDRSTADEHRYSRYSVTTFPSSIAPWSMIIVIHSYKSFFITSNLEGGTSTLYRLISLVVALQRSKLNNNLFLFVFFFSSLLYISLAITIPQVLQISHSHWSNRSVSFGTNVRFDTEIHRGYRRVLYCFSNIFFPSCRLVGRQAAMLPDDIFYTPNMVHTRLTFLQLNTYPEC